MYYAIVATLMFAFPLLSIGFESLARGASLDAAIVAKWFAFWSIGWRLLLAGARQIIQPAYTARHILGLSSDDSLLLVRELGFANVAIGVLGIASLFVPEWTFAATLAGGIFYAFAGANHVLQTNRNRLQNVAMVSDLFVASMLLGAVILAAL
ncbi:MAG TPA: DUF6790 family protein [Polyangiales bacterium]|nr:DUF6790 family protein [Polyangiales bacterium]